MVERLNVEVGPVSFRVRLEPMRGFRERDRWYFEDVIMGEVVYSEWAFYRETATDCAKVRAAALGAYHSHVSPIFNEANYRKAIEAIHENPALFVPL